MFSISTLSIYIYNIFFIAKHLYKGATQKGQIWVNFNFAFFHGFPEKHTGKKKFRNFITFFPQNSGVWEVLKKIRILRCTEDSI